jgi:hypothetical protein
MTRLEWFLIRLGLLHPWMVLNPIFRGETVTKSDFGGLKKRGPVTLQDSALSRGETITLSGFFEFQKIVPLHYSPRKKFCG